MLYEACISFYWQTANLLSRPLSSEDDNEPQKIFMTAVHTKVHLRYNWTPMRQTYTFLGRDMPMSVYALSVCMYACLDIHKNDLVVHNYNMSLNLQFNKYLSIIENSIIQGNVFGTMICGKQIDEIGKKDIISRFLNL